MTASSALDRLLDSIYLRLLIGARRELEAQGENPQLAEDLVQTAVVTWLELATIPERADAYLRRQTRKRIAELRHTR